MVTYQARQKSLKRLRSVFCMMIILGTLLSKASCVENQKNRQTNIIDILVAQLQIKIRETITVSMEREQRELLKLQKEKEWQETAPQKTEEILAPITAYSENDLSILSHVINGEAGMNWASDRHQQLVGMVVMNRVEHPAFPDTIENVVFQEGQYSCTKDGNYQKKPSERVIENAKKVLMGRVECPSNVIFQSNSKQGRGVYYQIYDKYLNSTTYFCYQ